MINSESQFIAPGGSSVVILLKIDPRPGVQKLFEMHLPVSFPGGTYNATIRNGSLKISYVIISPHKNIPIAACEMANIHPYCLGLASLSMAVIFTMEVTSYLALIHLLLCPKIALSR